MIWKTPHINKVYEALSAIADKRIQLISETEAHLTSTSGNKFYTITYDPLTGAMMSDDNSAYYTDSLSYPMIAFLMISGKISYNSKYLAPVANIKWKDINQQLKNDYDKSTEFVLSNIKDRGFSIDGLKAEVDRIYKVICDFKIESLGPKKKPSTAY